MLDAQHALLRALKRKAKQSGAGNDEEIARFLGVSRSTLYGWCNKRRMPRRQMSRLQAKFGVKPPSKVKLELPDNIDVVLAVYEVLELTQPAGVVLQFTRHRSRKQPGVWLVEAPHSRWAVTVDDKHMTLLRRGLPVMASSPTLTAVREVQRIVTLPRQAKSPTIKSKLGSLTRLRERFTMP